MKRRVRVKRLQEFSEGGDERVLVADDVRRTPEVRKHRMRHVGDEDVLRPLIGRRLVRVGELEMVQPLQIEPEHAARAVHLKAVRVSAADAEARGLKLADAAVLELQQRQERVVYGASRR